MKPLDVLLSDHVRPLMKDRGFSKKGRDFRLVARNGDAALVNFSPWRMDYYEVEFILDAGVLPRTWIEWKEDVRGQVSGSIVSALWWKRLNPPFSHPNSPAEDTDTWLFDLDEQEKISFFLGELASLADHLSFLLDRRNLISVVADPATKVQRLRHSREHAMALLLVDEEPSGELEKILRELESKDPSDNVASWVRARLSENRSG